MGYIKSWACLKAGVRALAISSRSPSQTKGFVVSAEAAAIGFNTYANPTRLCRLVRQSVWERRESSEVACSMRFEVSKLPWLTTLPAAGYPSGGQRANGQLPCSGSIPTRRKAVPRPTPTSMREPCNLALSNASCGSVRPQGRRRRHQAGRVRKGTAASGITGQVLRHMDRRSGGRGWQVGVRWAWGREGAHRAPPGDAPQGQAQHGPAGFDPRTVRRLGESLCQPGNVMRCDAASYGLRSTVSTRPGGQQTRASWRGRDLRSVAPVERNPPDKVCCQHELPSPSSILYARPVAFGLHRSWHCWHCWHTDMMDIFTESIEILSGRRLL